MGRGRVNDDSVVVILPSNNERGPRNVGDGHFGPNLIWIIRLKDWRKLSCLCLFCLLIRRTVRVLEMIMAEYYYPSPEIFMGTNGRILLYHHCAEGLWKIRRVLLGKWTTLDGAIDESDKSWSRLHAVVKGW